MMPRQTHFTTIDECADWIVERTGPEIRLALPLGLGKANRVANAIYRRAGNDPSLRLRIITALTPEIPDAGSELERRLAEPISRRVFADYPELLYARDRRHGALPENVEVYEFYMAPGHLLGNNHAQRNYISTNYTHVSRDLLEWDVNVVAQLVARRDTGGDAPDYSLSCNPDLTLDVARGQRTAGRPFLMVGEVNDNLPFMPGDAGVPHTFFDAVVTTPAPHFRLFGPPKTPVSDADYMIGLQASTLVRDGGTLQIGIGSLGDALVRALLMRQQDNAAYRGLLRHSGVSDRHAGLIERLGGLEPFQTGLYGATEMLVDGFLHLRDAGILSRRVYADTTIQKLLNEGRLEETVDIRTLQTLAGSGAINTVMTREDVDSLRKWGILAEGVFMDGSDLVAPSGARTIPDLGDHRCRDLLAGQCLGERLAGGVVASAGFFLGPLAFYERLRDMPESDRALINMTSVLSVNHLYRDVELETLQRIDARFFNSCLMATLTGAVVSDGLEDQRVLSGVGGQFDFVNMAHALPGGRSIITLRSTRESGGRTTSNIRFSYGHATIPRHLRDIVVTEYGIADLRGQSDAEVAARMLNVADSRFQEGLLRKAKRAGKIAADYRIPEAFRDNRPAVVRRRLALPAAAGWLTRYPFGSDLTEIEQDLAAALKRLRNRTSTYTGMADAFRAAIGSDTGRYPDHLERLGVDPKGSLRDRIHSRLVCGELDRTGD